MSRWRVESAYLGRYVGTGAFNTLVGFGVIFAVMWAGFSPFVANAAGYAVGLVLGFLLSKKIVFRSNGSFLSESGRYLIAFAIAFVLNLAALHIALDKLALPAALAQIVGAVVFSASMYAMTRFYAFSISPASKDPP